MGVGKKFANQPVVASHPVYQYWARRYSINLEAVLWEPEEVPTDAQMEDLKKILATIPRNGWCGKETRGGIRAQDQGAGTRKVVFDPCANTPDKGDFLAA